MKELYYYYLKYFFYPFRRPAYSKLLANFQMTVVNHEWENVTWKAISGRDG
jgi:hypothetical protein